MGFVNNEMDPEKWHSVRERHCAAPGDVLPGETMSLQVVSATINSPQGGTPAVLRHSDVLGERASVLYDPELAAHPLSVSVHQFSPQITKSEEPSEPESGNAGKTL